MAKTPKSKKSKNDSTGVSENYQNSESALDSVPKDSNSIKADLNVVEPGVLIMAPQREPEVAIAPLKTQRLKPHNLIVELDSILLRLQKLEEKILEK